MPDIRKWGSSMEEAMKDAEGEMKDMKERFEKDGISLSDSDWKNIAKKLFEDKVSDAKKADERRDPLYEALESVRDIVDSLSAIDKEMTELDKELIESIQELEETDYTEGEIESSMAPDSYQKDISWSTSKEDESGRHRYKQSVSHMKGQISKLKKKVQLYGNMQKLTIVRREV